MVVRRRGHPGVGTLICCARSDGEVEAAVTMVVGSERVFADGDDESRRHVGNVQPFSEHTVTAVDESGLAYLVRVASPADNEAIAALHKAALESATVRLHGRGVAVAAETATSLQPGSSLEQGFTLVAERAGDIVGVASFLRIGGSTEATVAVSVADVAGYRDIADRLVTQLAGEAHRCGVVHFVADMLAVNAAMLAVFVRAGFPTEIGVGDGIMHMSFTVDPARRDLDRATVRATPIWETTIGPQVHGR